MSNFTDLQLAWFRTHSGKIQDFPAPLENGALLATRAKGIYKPQGSAYALSIRVQLVSQYDDGEIIDLPGSGWGFAYHQESSRSENVDDDQLYSNVALLRCFADKRPVGVMKQVESRYTTGMSRYLIKGLALVVAKVGEFFILADCVSAENIPAAQLTNMILLGQAEVANFQFQEDVDFDEYDERLRTLKSIVARRGQQKFRNSLLKQYENKCAISSCEIVAILDAAHVRPYRGDFTNSLNNGLILRTDLHTLFDLDLLGVDPETLEVHISESIDDQNYQKFEGVKLRSPNNRENSLFKGALEYRWKLFNAKQLK